MEGNSCTRFSWRRWAPTAASAEQNSPDLPHSEQILPWEQGTKKRSLSLQRNGENSITGSNKLDISLCNLSKARHFRERSISTVDKDFFMLQNVVIKLLMRQGFHKSTGQFMMKQPSCTLLYCQSRRIEYEESKHWLILYQTRLPWSQKAARPKK